MPSWKEIRSNKWVRLGFWAVLYIAWVIWLGNYWWLFGLIPLFDYHITKKAKNTTRCSTGSMQSYSR